MKSRDESLMDAYGCSESQDVEELIIGPRQRSGCSRPQIGYFSGLSETTEGRCKAVLQQSGHAEFYDDVRISTQIRVYGFFGFAAQRSLRPRRPPVIEWYARCEQWRVWRSSTVMRVTCCHWGPLKRTCCNLYDWLIRGKMGRSSTGQLDSTAQKARSI